MILGSLRGRTLLTVFGVSAVALVLAAVLTSMSLRAQLLQVIERNLVAETRFATVLLQQHTTDGSPAALDAEADLIGKLTPARVTLIAADGRVVGDSAEPLGALARLDNHGGRPEILAAREGRIGIQRRHSETVGADLLYVAMGLSHPHVAVVRLALPLTDVDDQIAEVRRSLLLALGIALGCALGLAWASSLLLARRVYAIADVAQRYATGDFTQPTGDYGNDELGTVARALDTTARELGGRMAELEQDRARMAAMLAGMQEGVLVVNALGRLLLLNDAARRLLRIEALAPDQHYLEVLSPPTLAAALGRALEGRTPDGLEFSPAHELNRTIVARVAPIGSAGARGAIMVLHDITDLREADRMRRDFVANVSHELRTPLTAIQGYVEALQDNDPPGPQDAQRFLAIIARNTARMERLVRDLLRLASLEAGQEPVERCDVELNTLVSDVVADLAPAIEAKRQRIEITVDPSAATMCTDAAKLHDALRNLVENAVAYAPEGTRIDVRAVRSGGRTRLSVADQGPGIPEADLGRVFERFYRVDKARSRESGGTGLGLAIAKRLIGILGGDVSAANGQTGGAVFTISLRGA
ncbi:MAG: ATP-binding protein [Acidobacteria bacterium]|nr:ATP-binding protein [Acidobacteriota bacterium]